MSHKIHTIFFFFSQEPETESYPALTIFSMLVWKVWRFLCKNSKFRVPRQKSHGKTQQYKMGREKNKVRSNGFLFVAQHSGCNIIVPESTNNFYFRSFSVPNFFFIIFAGECCSGFPFFFFSLFGYFYIENISGIMFTTMMAVSICIFFGISGSSNKFRLKSEIIWSFGACWRFDVQMKIFSKTEMAVITHNDDYYYGYLLLSCA